MYDQVCKEALYTLLYGAVTVMSVIASCYLLLRRANAIAPEVTPPVRLRRWAGAFLASIALSHVWYMPIFFGLSDDADAMTDLLGGLIDCMTLFPLAIVVLIVMLQDRRRPLWPVAVMVAPLIAGSALCAATRSYAPLPVLHTYFLLLCVGLMIYMVREVRQYGHWLRDNFADLEHKEVWRSFLVLAIILLAFGSYVFTRGGPFYLYAMRIVYAILICYLVWRVETLSDLSVQAHEVEVAADGPSPPADQDEFETSQTIHEKIDALLQKHCIDNRLYLQHDLTISQLAQAIGTNRYYLSQYFSRQGMNYNAYINTLRINHFISLYHKAAAAQRHVTAKQLASDSGFRSYTTFSAVFKQLKGLTVTAWMRDAAR